MGKLFSEYKKAQVIKEQLQADTEKVKKLDKKRAEAIQKIADQMKQLQAKAADPTLAPDRKAEFQRQLEFTAKQGNLAAKRRQVWQGQRMRAIQENYVTEVTKVLSQIREKVAAYAKANGITAIYDKSAVATSGTNVLLFAKDKFDITADLLATLNEGDSQE